MCKVSLYNRYENTLFCINKFLYAYKFLVFYCSTSIYNVIITIITTSWWRISIAISKGIENRNKYLTEHIALLLHLFVREYFKSKTYADDDTFPFYFSDSPFLFVEELCVFYILGYFHSIILKRIYILCIGCLYFLLWYYLFKRRLFCISYGFSS